MSTKKQKIKLKENETMKGYKPLFRRQSERDFIDKNGKHFEIGQEYFTPIDKNKFFEGFDFYKYINDCFINYPFIQNTAILEIEASGKIEYYKDVYYAEKIKIIKKVNDIDTWISWSKNEKCDGLHKSKYCNESSGLAESQHCGFTHGAYDSTNLYLSKGFYRVNFSKWGNGVSNSSYVDTGFGIEHSHWISDSSALRYCRKVQQSSAVFSSQFVKYSQAVMMSYYVIESMAIRDCFFVKCCQAINYCMFCNNIIAKDFYIFNKKYSKAEFFKHFNKIEKILTKLDKENREWNPIGFFWDGDHICEEIYNLDYKKEKKAKEFPKELLRYIKKNFIKSEKEEEIFETIFQYKIGDCK